MTGKERKAFHRQVWQETQSRYPWAFEPDEFGEFDSDDYEEQEQLFEEVLRERTENDRDEQEAQLDEDYRKVFRLGSE